MFQKEFKKRGLHALNLSRNLEDSGTVTSVLIPWNTCGAFMAATLGVATGAYFWFAFFNLINPLIALLYSYINFKILPLDENSQTSTAKSWFLDVLRGAGYKLLLDSFIVATYNKKLIKVVSWWWLCWINSYCCALCLWFYWP